MSPASTVLTTRIRTIRGHKVLLASDLATLYGVQTKVLMQAVRRNMDRFPPDFAFPLTDQEVKSLRSQIVTLNESPKGRGSHSKYVPHAFTEQGVAMLSSVLKSKQAVQVNVEIMRAFVRLRDLAGQNRDLTRRLNDLESKYDRQFKAVFDAIRELMTPPAAPKRRIGFVQDA
ncbi:MAG: ORF6N domain-containing protein [Betaproteobacteria bacterium]